MRKLKLEEEFKEAKNKFENSRKLLQMDELQCRKRVLRRLGYASEEDTIADKVNSLIFCLVLSLFIFLQIFRAELHAS